MKIVPTLAIAAIAGLALGADALAATPSDYAWGWQLELEGAQGAHRVELTPGIYHRIRDAGLADLEVFNGEGASVPFGPVPARAGSNAVLPTSGSTLEPVAWFPLPRERTRNEGDVGLLVERDGSGRVLRIQASLADSPTSPADAQEDLLVDLGDRVVMDRAPARRIEALEIDWQDIGEASFSASFDVLGSDDLRTWRVLSPGVALLDLRQGEFRLMRRRIPIAQPVPRYLRLVRVDTGAGLRITGMTAESGATGATPAIAALSWLQPAATRSLPSRREFEFLASGPAPVEQLQVELASLNSLSSLTVQSRDRDDAPWTTRSNFTAFRIRNGTGEARNDVQALQGVRDRHWRVLAEPALDRAPVLLLAHRPDVFALLAQGPPPYVLVAGSDRAIRPQYPMGRLLAVLDSDREGSWRLSPARIGAPVSVSGMRAAPAPPMLRPWKLWALWSVLGLGAFTVIVMVVKLLRQPPSVASEP